MYILTYYFSYYTQINSGGSFILNLIFSSGHSISILRSKSPVYINKNCPSISI